MYGSWEYYILTLVFPRTVRKSVHRPAQKNKLNGGTNKSLIWLLPAAWQSRRCRAQDATICSYYTHGVVQGNTVCIEPHLELSSSFRAICRWTATGRRRVYCIDNIFNPQGAKDGSALDLIFSKLCFWNGNVSAQIITLAGLRLWWSALEFICKINHFQILILFRTDQRYYFCTLDFSAVDNARGLHYEEAHPHGAIYF